MEIISAFVGKSGAGIIFNNSFTESFGESIRAIVASTTSFKLCGGMSVAMPTAIPEAPLSKTFGILDDRNLGSISVPSKLGPQSTVP